MARIDEILEGSGIQVAAINSYDQIVISGQSDKIEEFIDKFNRKTGEEC